MKNRKIKLALIALGSAVAIGTPAIIMGSIYAYNNNQIPVAQKNLNKFYNEEAGSLFTNTNFRINQPTAADGKYFVKNVTVNNIIFTQVERLKNFSYNMEITQVIPNEKAGTLTFKYSVSLITDPSISITVESETYSGCFDDFGNFHTFSK